MTNSGYIKIFCIDWFHSKMLGNTLTNPALNLAPFGRWTLRDKAAQRR
jgi:hypothetical protein